MSMEEESETVGGRGRENKIYREQEREKNN
jgi:hypothetical protein